MALKACSSRAVLLNNATKTLLNFLFRPTFNGLL